MSVTSLVGGGGVLRLCGCRPVPCYLFSPREGGGGGVMVGHGFWHVRAAGRRGCRSCIC